MKVCKNCSEEYGNEATFCNICDMDLTESNSETQEKDISDNDMLILGIAKNNLIKAHQTLAFIQILFIALLVYLTVSNGFNFRGLVLVLLVSVFPVIHIYVAKGIRKNKAWAHTGSIVLGILMLLAFPVGTLFGFIMLKNVFKKEWKLIELG